MKVGAPVDGVFQDTKKGIHLNRRNPVLIFIFAN